MEIPSSTHPGLISKSQTEEKARFTTAISKITPVVNLFRKMYGPSRLTKLIRTDYNTYKLTQNPSVILDNIKISHPLVKLMTDYVKKLEGMGDSSKYFIILVGDLIEEVVQVLDKGVKATILSALLHESSDEVYELTKDLKEEHVFIKDGEIERGTLRKVLESLIKEPVSRELVYQGVINTKGYTLENIRVCKVPTGSLEDSYVVDGMVFEREAEGKVKEIEDASTSIYNTSIDIPRGELKSTVQMESAEQLARFSKDEVLGMKKKVEGLTSDVIIFSGRVNDVYLDLLDRANKLVFKVMSKHDLRRMRDLLGGSISQEFEECPQGRVKSVSVVREGSKKYTKFITDKNRVCSLVLKHPLEYKLDELERDINKSLVALQRNVKDKKISLCVGEAFEKKVGEAFAFLSQESLKKYKEGEDLLDKHLVYGSISKGLSKGVVKGKTYDLYSTKLKAVVYALEFVGTVFEIEDYLVGIPPKLNIRPQMNQNWDEDH